MPTLDEIGDLLPSEADQQQWDKLSAIGDMLPNEGEEERGWLEGFGRGVSNLGSRIASRTKQMGSQLMLEQTAGRAADRQKSFDDILAEERQSSMVDMQGKPVETWTGGEYVSAAARWIDAKYADLIGTDDEAAANEYAVSMQKNMDAFAATPKSDIAEKFQKKAMVKDATFGEMLANFGGAIIENPLGGLSWALETAGESAPTLAGAAAGTLLTRNPVTGMAIAGGGSYATERYTTPGQFFQEKGLDLKKPEDRQRLLNDPKLMKEAADRGVVRGLIIGAFDMVSAGVAGKPLVKNPLGEAVAQSLTQAILGGGGEATAQVATGDKLDWNEIGAETFAETATLPLDMVIGGRGMEPAAPPPGTAPPGAPGTATAADVLPPEEEPPGAAPGGATIQPPIMPPPPGAPPVAPTPERIAAVAALPEQIAQAIAVPDSPRLTEQDRRSPIPNEIIDAGKATVEDATGRESTFTTTTTINGKREVVTGRVSDLVAANRAKTAAVVDQIMTGVSPAQIASPAGVAAPPVSATGVPGVQAPAAATAPVAPSKAVPEVLPEARFSVTPERDIESFGPAGPNGVQARKLEAARRVKRDQPIVTQTEAGTSVEVSHPNYETFVARVDGRRAGELNISPNGPYASSTVVPMEFQRQGMAGALYAAAEAALGRPMIPSPMGLSDQAIGFWKKRLAKLEPEAKQALLQEALDIGIAQKIGKSARARVDALGYIEPPAGVAASPARVEGVASASAPTAAKTSVAASPAPKMSKAEFEAEIAGARTRIEERKVRAKELAAPGKPIRMAHKKEPARTALVGPDMSEPGRFRLTRFDEQGPVGHSTRDTLEQATAEALGEGYDVVTEPDAQKALKDKIETKRAGPAVDTTDNNVVRLFRGGEESTSPSAKPGKVKVLSDIKAAVERMRKKARSALEARMITPEILEALAQMDAIPPTDKEDGTGVYKEFGVYGSPEWWRRRVYNFGTPKKPVNVRGSEEAVEQLIDRARDMAVNEINEGRARRGEQLLEHYTPDKKRKATIIIGPPAAGKSTIANAIAVRMKAAIVDVDDAKKVIPEYYQPDPKTGEMKGGLGANAVHEESSELGTLVLRELISSGDNLVIPKIGDNPAKMEKLRAELKSLGYDVQLVVMDVDAQTASDRMIKRFKRTGRLINPRYFLDVVGKPVKSYTTLKTEGKFDGYARVISTDLGGPSRVSEAQGREAVLVRGEGINRDGTIGSVRPTASGGAAQPAAKGQGKAEEVALPVAKFQARTLREGKESLESIGLPPTREVTTPKGKTVTKKIRYTTRRIAAALEARQRAQYGTIARNDRSPEASDRIANWIVDEIDFEMQPGREEKSGVGWYSQKFQRALDAFGSIFPELVTGKKMMSSDLPGLQRLKTKKNARDFLTALIAITSDGSKVAQNFDYGARLYQEFRRTGSIDVDAMTEGGDRVLSMKTNVANILQLLEQYGPADMHTILMKEKPVSELKQDAKITGTKFSLKLQAHLRMPLAALIFGPKLGSFYANLMGAHGYLTMDRWWSRTFNRYRGQLLKRVSGTADRPTDKQGNKIGLARFKAMIGQPNLSDEEALSEATRHSKLYEEKGFKNGTEVEKAANTIKKDALGTEDTPFGTVDRTFMIETVERARQKLADRGTTISVADIQAILWYYEKRLYSELGAKETADISYEDVAKTVAQRTAAGDRPGRPPLSATVEGPDGARFSLREEGRDRTAGREGAGRGGADRGRPARGADETTQQAEVALPGLYELYPASVGPNADVTAAKKAYMKSIGQPYRRQAEYVAADPKRGKRIADAFDQMEHNPSDPQVAAAYRALIDETVAQYHALQKALKLKIEFIKPGQTDPYQASPRLALEDVLNNGHLWVFPTESGFGSITDIRDNPLLEQTDIEIGGHKLVANDVFRIVHDIFGHGPEGAGFGPTGEENAWQSHVRMYSPLAARAMTSETRGQNSWVNFGPHGAANRANPKNTIFADQKIGLLPDWVITEGMAKDEQARFSRRAVTETPAFKKWFGDSKIVDADGKPRVVYHGTSQSGFSEFNADAPTAADAGYYAAGFHFTPNPEIASRYAREGRAPRRVAERTPGVYPVYLSIQKPFIWDITRSGFEPSPFMGLSPKEITAKLRERGHDGVTVVRNGAIQEAIAFDPSQIKSVYNTGDFDPANPDIRFLRVGPVEHVIEQVQGGQVHYALNEKFKGKADALFKDLRAKLDSLGLTNVDLKIWQQIFADMDTGFMGVDGVYVRNLIQIALEAQTDPDLILHHEAIHALWSTFTDSEKAILERKSKKDWVTDEIKQAYPESQWIEEGVAHAYTEWLKGARMDGMVARIFKKIKTFLKALAQTLTKHDIRTTDDIFRQVTGGEIGRRQQEALFKDGKDDLAKFPTPPKGPNDSRFNLQQPPHGLQQAQQVMQGFIARGQPVDRAIRVLFDLLGGLDNQNRWRPAKRLSDKLGPQGFQGAGIGGIIGSGIGTFIGGPVGTAVGFAAGGTVGAYILGSAPAPANGKFGWFSDMAENAKRGLIDGYGLDPEYIKAYQQSDLGKTAILRKTQGIMKVLSNAGVSTREAEVLQQILSGKPVNDDYMKRLALPIRQAIDDLGAEAVSLGLISAESFERNRGAYLHRVYAKHEIDQGTLAGWVSTKMTSRRKKIIGDSLKGRGIFWDMTVERLMRDAGHHAAPTKGDKWRVIDRMSADGSKATKRVFLPTGKPLPMEFSGAGWVDRGAWEVRQIGKGKATLWRDYTEDERGKMGEIVDARYTIAKTFMLMANDLSTGRFFKEVSEKAEWTQDKPPADDDAWMEGGEYGMMGGRYWTDTNIQWVHVPDTEIAKTGGKKRWGALSGKYVRAEIWRDLNEINIAQNPGTWRKLLTQWKKNKTARNPVVHMNNIVSNVMFMDLADVRTQDLVAGLKSYAKGDALYQEALENGAFGSDVVAQELRDNVLKPILEEIAKTQPGGSSFMNRFGVAGQVAETVWGWAKGLDERMLQAYQMEDEIFRMAAYTRRRGQGESPEVAAQNARDQFLNYDIRAPWIAALRNTVFPFISYTYRAVPKLMESIAHRPWKLGKYAAIAYAVNALSYLLDEGDDEEERERAALRDEEQGYSWLGVPRMVRMPWRDKHGLPVFLDVRRWIPAGDVFDTNQGSSAIPVPGPLQFGGPLQLAFELMLNKQAFTGDEITNDLTDTNAEKAWKVADWAWKAWTPAAFWVPNSWYWTKIGNALYGATDTAGHPYSVPQAALSSIGIKVKPVDVDDGIKWHYLDFQKVQKELKAQLRSNGSRLERGLISQSAHDDAAATIMHKFETLGQEMEEFSARTKKPKRAAE